MSDNLKIWDKLRTPDEKALKEIKGGRLKGMTDISPQWRYKVMTEQFGAIGIGWNYRIDKQWIEEREGLSCAFTNASIKIKIDGEWSEWIPGTGGSMLVAQETAKKYVSDEAYKMSLTDALSVAMKMLGVGADIYLGAAKENSKYENPGSGSVSADTPKISKAQSESLERGIKNTNDESFLSDFLGTYNIKSISDLPASKFGAAVNLIKKRTKYGESK